MAVSDRIRVVVTGDTAVQTAATAHHDWIAGEVLGREVVVGGSPGALGDDTSAGAASEQGPRTSAFDAVRTLELDGHSVRIAITKDVET